jgi:hypothetical protein
LERFLLIFFVGYAFWGFDWSFWFLWRQRPWLRNGNLGLLLTHVFFSGQWSLWGWNKFWACSSGSRHHTTCQVNRIVVGRRSLFWRRLLKNVMPFRVFLRICEKCLQNTVCFVIFRLFNFWTGVIHVGLVLFKMKLIGLSGNATMCGFGLDFRSWGSVIGKRFIFSNVDSTFLKALHELFVLDRFGLEWVWCRNWAFGIDWGFLYFWSNFWSRWGTQPSRLFRNRFFSFHILVVLLLLKRMQTDLWLFEFHSTCERIWWICQLVSFNMLIESWMNCRVFGYLWRQRRHLFPWLACRMGLLYWVLLYW